MTNIPAAPPVSFVDNPFAPDIFADGATGWFLSGNSVRIAFESLRVNHISSPGPINRVVVAHLVMPLEAAEQFAKGLLAFIESQRAAAATTKPVQGTPTLN